MNKFYRIKLIQKQPIHLGVGNFGVVAETNIEIMPWQFLASILNNLGLYDYDIDINFDEIIKNISVFKSEINDINKNQVKTYISTSIIPGNRSAKDNSLHEIEYISNIDNKGNNLVWEGFVNIDFRIDQINWENLNGKELYIGGEQKYGFGLIEIISIENCDLGIGFLKKIEKENMFNTTYPIALRLFNNEGYGKKLVYKGFYGY